MAGIFFCVFQGVKTPIDSLDKKVYFIKSSTYIINIYLL